MCTYVCQVVDQTTEVFQKSWIRNIKLSLKETKRATPTPKKQRSDPEKVNPKISTIQ